MMGCGAFCRGIGGPDRVVSPSKTRRSPVFGMGGQAEVEKFVQVRQSRTKQVPVAFAGFDEGREFLQLLATDGGLRIERLQIVAKMTVDIFVVVTFRELAELPGRYAPPSGRLVLARVGGAVGRDALPPPALGRSTVPGAGRVVLSRPR